MKEKVLNLLKKIFLLQNKNSELIYIRSFNIIHVSHFVKAEPLGKIFLFFFSKKVSAYLNVFNRKIFKKKIFKHDDQKVLN